MKYPTIADFLDLKNPKDSLGPSKVEEMNKEALPPKEVFMSWEYQLSSQDRKSVSKRFSRPLLIIGIFLGFVLLIMQQFYVIIAIGSLIFFFQAIMKMSPQDIRYEISNHGIMIGDNLYYWDKLRRFYFLQKDNVEVVAIDTVLGLPGRIYISYENRDKVKIKEVLERHLHFLQSEPKTFFDNAYDRVLKKFSLDEEELEEKEEPGIKVSEADKKDKS